MPRNEHNEGLPFTMSGRQCAYMLQVKAPQISMWAKEQDVEDPFPVASRSKGRSGFQYDPPAILAWAVRREVNKQLSRSSSPDVPKVLNFQAEKTRLTKAQADKAELENLQRMGKLAEIDVLQELVTNFAAVVKSSLDAIPAELKRRCPYLDQAALYEIETIIVELRNSLRVGDIRERSTAAND